MSEPSTIAGPGKNNYECQNCHHNYSTLKEEGYEEMYVFRSFWDVIVCATIITLVNVQTTSLGSLSEIILYVYFHNNVLCYCTTQANGHTCTV